MPFALTFTTEAQLTLADLAADPSHAMKLKRVRKALALPEDNPRHPGLRVHPFRSLAGPNGEPIWEAYVENRTPQAWRIWFWYGPSRNGITILAIGPHPD